MIVRDVLLSPDVPLTEGRLRPPVSRRERVALGDAGDGADLRTDANWWTLYAPQGRNAPPVSPWEWLDSMRDLPAGVRPVVDLAGMRHLVIDAPAVRGRDFDTWLAAARGTLAEATLVAWCARPDLGVRAVLDALAGPGQPAESGPRTGPAAPRPLPAELHAGLEWPASERADGSLGFELGVSDAPNPAIAHLDVAGALVVSVTLGHWPAATPASRDALAQLVLLAAGATRLVRPFVAADGAEASAGFEVRFAAPVSAAELDHALHALAAAVDACAAEAPLVVREDVARAVLARWSVAADAAPGQNPSPRRNAT